MSGRVETWRGTSLAQRTQDQRTTIHTGIVQKLPVGARCFDHPFEAFLLAISWKVGKPRALLNQEIDELLPFAAVGARLDQRQIPLLEHVRLYRVLVTSGGEIKPAHEQQGIGFSIRKLLKYFFVVPWSIVFVE